MSLNDARPVRLTKEPPKLTAKCIIDGHMHFMSGRTTPLPLLWNQGLFGRRALIEWLVSIWPVRWIKTKNMGRLQKQDITDSERGKGIAATIVEQHDQLFHPSDSKGSKFSEYFDLEYVSFMVAMMMDMEYACLDGYQKKLVYYKSTKNTYVYKKRKDDGTCEEKEVPGKEKDLFQLWKQQVDQTETAIKRHPWKFLALYHYDPRRWNYDINCNYDKFNLIGPWNYPFSLIATAHKSGLYAGFKMYSPLGYQPSDQNMPYLDSFYAKCAAEGIPVLVHCSEGGMITHDWKFYLDHEKDPAVKNNYLKLGKFYDAINPILYDEGRPRRLNYRNLLEEEIHNHAEAVAFLRKRDCVETLDDSDFGVHIERRYDEAKNYFDCRKEYFVDNFINPRAWRKVLVKHPDLKICFAHFGGDAWTQPLYHYRRGLECPWIQEIISLIKDYKNVYTDISYFNTNSGHDYRSEFRPALEKFLHDEELLRSNELVERGTSVLDRILWGTDWYLTEIDNLFYDDHCNGMKDLCDTDKYEGSFKTLYLRFTMVNPMEFFRIGDVAENFAAALKKGFDAKINADDIAKIDRTTLKISKIKSEANRFRKWLNER